MELEADEEGNMNLTDLEAKADNFFFRSQEG